MLERPTPVRAVSRLQLCFALAIAGMVLPASSAAAQDALEQPPEQALREGSGKDGGKGEAQPQGTAAAQPGSAAASDQALNDQKARELFEKGREAYESGEYRDAWDYFHQAYRLSKRPELLYNVGQAADRLRYDREAIAAFELYLEKLPNADNRREVENRLRALEDRVREEEARQALSGEEGDGSGTPTVSADGESTIAPPGSQPARRGWYIGAALGLGLVRDGLSNTGVDEAITGGTGAMHVAVGYGVVNKLVIGGALFLDWSFAPQYGDRDIDSANLTLIGPFADYHLDPGGSGWHLLGALGFGGMNVSGDSLPSESAGGAALIVGGGYEWPLTKEWALGALGRLVLARLSQDFADHSVIAPSVAFSATWY